MDKQKEIWKDVSDYDGWYQVSNKGKIKSFYYHIGLISNKGMNSPLSKVTEEEVREIRKLYKQGYTQTLLAKNYTINQQSISHIVNYKRWGHI